MTRRIARPQIVQRAVIEINEPKKPLLVKIDRDFLMGFRDLVVETVCLFFPFFSLFIHILKRPIYNLKSQGLLLETSPPTKSFNEQHCT